MKHSSSRHAVVLGADVNGLGHVRSLGKMGVYSYVICSRADYQNIARFSKYCIPLFVPNKTPNYEHELREKLIELSKSLNFKLVLYATSDFFVNFIASNRAVLQRYYFFNIPEDEILQLIINKYETDKLARSSGLSSPKTLQIIDGDTAESISRSISFPSIIKPKDSFSITFPGKNKIINNESELNFFINRYKELKNHIIIQEIVPGCEKNIYQCTVYLGKKSPAQFFTMQKIHQRPPGYGVATIGRSVTVSEIVKKTEKILDDIGYSGFASVEYKKSDKDSKYYLIEINPRLPWYNGLFLSCGVNFPYLAYLDLKNEGIFSFPLQNQRDNIYWMHFKNELSGLLQRKKYGYSLNYFEVVNTFFKVRSFAYFDPSDMKPFWGSIIELMKSIKSKIY